MAAHVLSTLTVCGIAELDEHPARGVTDVLTILDPLTPDPPGFAEWPAHRRTVLRFHDDIKPLPGRILPTPADIEAILAYGREMRAHPGDKHLLVHCHMGMSRSTAAMAIMLADAEPQMDADEVLARVHAVRKRLWPNSLMIAMADDMLGRGGELTQALRRLYGRQLAIFPHYDEMMRSFARGREIDMAIR